MAHQRDREMLNHASGMEAHLRKQGWNQQELEDELAKLDTFYDGAFVGRDGKVGTSLSEVKPVMPKHPKSDELIIHVNGVWTQKNQQDKALEAIAERTGHPVVGIHNATEDRGFKWFRTHDGVQCFEDKLHRGDNLAAQQLEHTVYEQVKHGKPVYVMGHSQGGLIVSRAMNDVRNHLAEDAIKEKQKAGMNITRQQALHDAEGQMGKHIKAETFGAAAWTYPDGPQYVHHVNRCDPVPQFCGLGAVGTDAMYQSNAGRGAVVHRFDAHFLDPGNAHDFDNNYLGHWVPFDQARKGEFHDRPVARPYEHLSPKDLAHKREGVEDKFYWSRHDGTSQMQRKDLEVDWNTIRYEQSMRDHKPWTYKYDRRDYFEFSQQSEMNRRGDMVQTVHASGQLHSREETIDWTKDTGIGKKQHEAVGHELAGKNGGTKPGSLVDPSFGVDPEGVNGGRIDRSGKDPWTGLPPDRLNVNHAPPAPHHKPSQDLFAFENREQGKHLDSHAATLQVSQTTVTDRHGHRTSSPPHASIAVQQPAAHAHAAAPAHAHAGQQQHGQGSGHDHDGHEKPAQGKAENPPPRKQRQAGR